MSKTIVVAGFGPGIATSVAEKFGAAGFAVALVARNADRLAAGVQQLLAKGIRAAAFPADLSAPSTVKPLIEKIRAELGPIEVLHWNAYSNAAADVLTADVTTLHATLDVAVTSFIGAVQAALPDLREHKGAVLATNGGLLFDDPSIDERSVTWSLTGLSMGNAAKHKLLGLLSHKLKAEGVYVGEVIVTGTVRGSAFDKGNANLEGSAIAQKFWDLFSERKETSVKI
jgi:NAD(P)-dependent dehydrogenase (short-subunit alcohol dehydrogenase family)